MPTEPSPQSIKEILEKGKHVILKGPPGTGKTHLAMKTIREFIGETGAQVSIVRHQMAAYCSADNEHENWGNPKAAFLVYPDPINDAEAKPEFHGWLGIPKEEPKTGDNLSLRNPIGIISVPFRPELFIRGNDDDDKEKLIAEFHGEFTKAIREKTSRTLSQEV